MTRPYRPCALCSNRVKPKERGKPQPRLCADHDKEYTDLTIPWLAGIIKEADHQYNLSRQDYRAGVQSLEQLAGKI